MGAPALASARGTAALLVLLAALPAAARATVPLVAEGGCRDGEPNGAYTLRVADGRLRVAGAFARGHRTGTFVFWSDRGSRIAVVPYDDDRKTGTIAVWYPSPAPSADAPRKSESAYVDDRLHGEKRSWFASGKPRTWLRYERGQLVEARAWNAAGAPLSEAAARAQAARDAAADEAFYATLEALVAEHRPKCEALHNDENRGVTLPSATNPALGDAGLVPIPLPVHDLGGDAERRLQAVHRRTRSRFPVPTDRQEPVTNRARERLRWQAPGRAARMPVARNPDEPAAPPRRDR